MLKKLLIILTSLIALTSCQSSKYMKNVNENSDGLWTGGQEINPELAPGIASTIFFKYDSSTIDSENKELLDRQVAWWKSNNQQPAIAIEGHCDDRGTREYNLALGERRANIVKQYMVAKGIPLSKVDTISYGKERPLAIGDDELTHSKNRRAVTTVAQ